MRELSELFHGACNRIHEATTKLYEELHMADGNPATDRDFVSMKLSDWRQWVNLEIDLIRQSVKEHEEYVAQQDQ
jgi:hypothetical protein